MNIKDGYFLDESGRKLMLRGVNLGGSSKVPRRPDGATHIAGHFFEHRDVSFAGRPFPLEEADEHFSRLRHWGFDFLRFLVTWEAIEHAGPGKYDNEYLDYLAAVLEKAGQYGFNLFIDPHQDVWSRFSGGDGAPGWTLEAVGFEPRNFLQSGAAVTHQAHGDPFPWMLWPSNGDRLASATMFTLFFAGNDFAPRTLIEGEPAQEYLQRHYIDAVKQVAAITRNMSHVAGFDTLNEPDMGWIGHRDIACTTSVRCNGPAPSPWESIAMGSGFPMSVEIRKFASAARSHKRQLLNMEKVSAWKPGRRCVWRENGVWDIDSTGQPRLLRPNHFAQVNGKDVDYFDDYFRPFANRYAKAVREVRPETIVFLDPSPLYDKFNWGKPGDAVNVVYAPHWYDVVTMVFKSFNPWLAIDIRNLKFAFTPPLVRRSLASQLRHFKSKGHSQPGKIPVILGEMGIPFDMHKAEAYKSGNYSNQQGALGRCLHAVETTLSNVTIWNYTSDNTNERGDQWNGEDFSIFSRDQQSDKSDINSGGRALPVLLRPYPQATSGTPLHLSYSAKRRHFSYKFRHEAGITQPTEIYVPSYIFPRGYNVMVSDGTWKIHADSQILEYHHDPAHELHEIRIMPVK